MASGFNPHFAKQLARTEPGPGASDPSDDGAAGVKSKSIPNVPTGRLVRVQRDLHETYHTPEGLRAHDGPRRDLIDNGMKARMVTHELHLRGANTLDCQFCGRY